MPDHPLAQRAGLAPPHSKLTKKERKKEKLEVLLKNDLT